VAPDANIIFGVVLDPNLGNDVRLTLIATGFAQATLAINVATAYINPKAKVFPGHSSERRL
jgi:cell division GTPase FtsZ